MTQATAVAPATKRTRVETQALAIRWGSYALIALFVLYLIPKAIAAPATFVEVLLSGLKFGALYALVALGYTMVYGIIELINFSHGDLFMLSAVVSGLVLIRALGVEKASVGAFAMMIGVMILVMVLASALNALAERVAYRRLRRAPKLAPLITAVGLSFIYQFIGIQMNGSGATNWPTILGGSSFNVGPVRVEWALIAVLAITIPLLLALNYLITHTRQGKAMRATAQDQDAARLMGIDVDKTIALTFAIGGALAGAAGMLYLETQGNTTYQLGFRLGLIAFTAAVLGGIGSLNGAVVGGFIIGFLQQINDALILGSAWSQTVVFSVLILVMVFKPEGLLGNPTQEKV